MRFESIRIDPDARPELLTSHVPILIATKTPAFSVTTLARG